MRRGEVSVAASLGSPEGNRLGAGADLLVLRRPDGSVVAFGPTPEAVREVAEDDLRKGRRAPEGADGEGGRGR